MSAELAKHLRILLASCNPAAFPAARAALAAHEAEAKAAPANVIDAVLATTAAIHEAGAMEEIAKYRRLTDVVSEPLTDEQVAAALEAGGIGVQRFMGGISGTKDCWSTQGSADIRKVAAVVRGLIANGGKA
jgi:hypothetical protein